MRGSMQRRLFVLVLCGLFLSGCGFHLRGSQLGVQSLPPLYIKGEDLKGVDVIYRVMRQAGVSVVGRGEEGALVLHLISEKRERRVLSVNTAGKVQEYELHYEVVFAVEDKDGKVLMPEQRISLIRDFDYSGDDVLAKESEAEDLYRAMLEEAAGQIIMRMNAQLGQMPAK
ncbi:MAG: hypothetical protein GC138_03080 [Gammaproteobacteria bacterium]|nr:hypothetical protein [Gammaproteobacteria bacterium]